MKIHDTLNHQTSKSISLENDHNLFILHSKMKIIHANGFFYISNWYNDLISIKRTKKMGIKMMWKIKYLNYPIAFNMHGVKKVIIDNKMGKSKH